MKQRIQGMILGMLVMALIFGAATIAAAATRTIEVTDGVGIVVNGVRQSFADDSMPFVSEGRTFLPVRGIADALGLDVYWDGETSTVFLSTPAQTLAPPLPPLEVPAPLPEVLPEPVYPLPPTVIPAPLPEILPEPMPQLPAAFFEAIPFFERGGQRRNQFTTGTVNMLGVPYPNSLHINFPRTGIGQWEAWKNFNLNEDFESLTGTIGRVDGTGAGANSISFIGDGRTLASFVVDGDTLPMDIAIDVRGVRILRIQFDESIRNASIAFTNAMIE